MRGHSLRLIAALVALTTTAAACGSDDSDDASSTSAPAATTSTAPGASTPATSAPGSSAPSSSTGGSEAPATGEPYRIGFAGDFTGSLAGFGQPLFNGFQTYIDHVNKTGGVDGHPVEIESEDYANDVNQARLAVDTLTQKHVLGIFGGLSGNAWGAMAPMAAQTKVAQVTIGVTDDKIVPPQPYVYSSQIGAKTNAELALQFLQEKLGPGKHSIASLGFSSAYGQGFTDYLTERTKDLGWDYVDNEVIPVTATDAATPARQIADAKPEAVVTFLLDSITPLGVRALRDNGFEGPIVNYLGGESEATFKTLDDPDFYAIRSYAYPQDPSIPGAVEMLAQAQDAGMTSGDDVEWFTHGYVQAMVAVQAMEGCSATECTGETFNTALDSMGTLDTKGLSGDIALSADRHRIAGAGRIYQWDDSQGRAIPASDWISTDVGVTK